MARTLGHPQARPPRLARSARLTRTSPTNPSLVHSHHRKLLRRNPTRRFPMDATSLPKNPTRPPPHPRLRFSCPRSLFPLTIRGHSRRPPPTHSLARPPRSPRRPRSDRPRQLHRVNRRGELKRLAKLRPTALPVRPHPPSNPPSPPRAHSFRKVDSQFSASHASLFFRPNPLRPPPIKKSPALLSPLHVYFLSGLQF